MIYISVIFRGLPRGSEDEGARENSFVERGVNKIEKGNCILFTVFLYLYGKLCVGVWRGVEEQ